MQMQKEANEYSINPFFDCNWNIISCYVQGKSVLDVLEYYRIYNELLKKKYEMEIVTKEIIRNDVVSYHKLLADLVNQSHVCQDNSKYYDLRSVFNLFLRELRDGKMLCNNTPSMFPTNQLRCNNNDPFTYYDHNPNEYYYYSERSQSFPNGMFSERPLLKDSRGHELVSPFDDSSLSLDQRRTTFVHPSLRPARSSSKEPSNSTFSVNHSIKNDENRFPKMVIPKPSPSIDQCSGIENPFFNNRRVISVEGKQEISSQSSDNKSTNVVNEKDIINVEEEESKAIHSSPTQLNDDDDNQMKTNNFENSIPPYGYFSIPPEPQYYVQTSPSEDFKPVSTHNDYIGYVGFIRNGGGISKPHIYPYHPAKKEDLTIFQIERRKRDHSFEGHRQQFHHVNVSNEQALLSSPDALLRYQEKAQQFFQKTPVVYIDDNDDQNFRKPRKMKKKKKKKKKKRKRRKKRKEEDEMMDDTSDEDEDDDDEQEDEEQERFRNNQLPREFYNDFVFLPLKSGVEGVNGGGYFQTEKERIEEMRSKHHRDYQSNQDYRMMYDAVMTSKNTEQEENSAWEQNELLNWMSQKNNNIQEQEQEQSGLLDEVEQREWERKNSWVIPSGSEDFTSSSSSEEGDSQLFFSEELLLEEKKKTQSPPPIFEDESPRDRRKRDVQRRRRNGGVRQTRKRKRIAF